MNALQLNLLALGNRAFILLILIARFDANPDFNSTRRGGR